MNMLYKGRLPTRKGSVSVCVYMGSDECWEGVVVMELGFLFVQAADVDRQGDHLLRHDASQKQAAKIRYWYSWLTLPIVWGAVGEWVELTIYVLTYAIYWRRLLV